MTHADTWKVSTYRPNLIIARDPNESTYERGDDKFQTIAACQDPIYAKQIVFTHNSYAALVEALGELVEAVGVEAENNGLCGFITDRLDKARAALTMAV